MSKRKPKIKVVELNKLASAIVCLIDFAEANRPNPELPLERMSRDIARLNKLYARHEKDADYH